MFLLSQKKKQEKPDGKRKKKKGFPRRPQIRQYRICWFEEVGYTVSVRHKKQCCSDIVFCQISLGGPATFLKGAGANSAGPNHSLRIRWFEGVGYTVSVRYKKQCCSDIVFCQISLVGPTPFSKGVGRIRWSVEMVGGDRLSTSYPVGVGASATRKNE